MVNHLDKMHKLGLEKVLDAIKKKLNGETVDLPIQIKDLDFLTNKDHKTRKECIALPFNAVIKAIHD